jgi:uncharacterized membrane protein YdjX (TVP38/TMEM64 family)
MNRFRPYLRGLVLIALLIGLGYLVKVTGLYGLLDETWVDEQIRDKGLMGNLLFLAAGMMMTAVGFPRQAVSFLGGYGFGLGEGAVLALGSSVLGCVLAFYTISSACFPAVSGGSMYFSTTIRFPRPSC